MRAQCRLKIAKAEQLLNHWLVDNTEQVFEEQPEIDTARGYLDDVLNQAEADTFEDMLEALYIALPYVEDHEGSDIYKTGAVSKALRIIRAAIKQAEGIDDDHVKCPHCGAVSHIGGLIGPTTDDCPRCGKTALKGAP